MGWTDAPRKMAVHRAHDCPEDWAAEVSCVEDGEEQLSQLTRARSPEHPARAAPIGATLSGAGPSLRGGHGGSRVRPGAFERWWR